MTDGNFVLNHLLSRGSTPGVSLTDGAAYMIARDLLKEHIPSSNDTDQVRGINPPPSSILRKLWSDRGS